jgi:hypothetical protein
MLNSTCIHGSTDNTPTLRKDDMKIRVQYASANNWHDTAMHNKSHGPCLKSSQIRAITKMLETNGLDYVQIRLHGQEYRFSKGI